MVTYICIYTYIHKRCSFPCKFSSFDSGAELSLLAYGLVCGVDTRKNLYVFVVSSGGTNMVPEIIERRTKEPTALAPLTMVLRVVAPLE